jgi:hypothetical protein
LISPFSFKHKIHGMVFGKHFHELGIPFNYLCVIQQ